MMSKISDNLHRYYMSILQKVIYTEKNTYTHIYKRHTNTLIVDISYKERILKSLFSMFSMKSMYIQPLVAEKGCKAEW